MTIKKLYKKMEDEFARCQRIIKIAQREKDELSERYWEGKKNSAAQILDLMVK
jgi:hypothetical protein